MDLRIFESALKEWQLRQKLAGAAALKESADLLQSETRKALSLRAHQKGTKTPSAPGQPPAYISGALAESVQIQGPNAIPGGFEARIGPTIVYARIQELGGVTGRGHQTRIPARPYLDPTVRENLDEIALIFYSAWS